MEIVAQFLKCGVATVQETNRGNPVRRNTACTTDTDNDDEAIPCSQSNKTYATPYYNNVMNVLSEVEEDEINYELSQVGGI